MTPYRHDQPGRADEDASIDLRAGDDFRLPRLRREVWHRFYEFHLRYRAHPGGVYYVMPYLRERLGWDTEAALWFAFLNGNTQNPVTSLIIHRRFPTVADTDGLTAWFTDAAPYLDFDTDRRHHKPFLPQAAKHYRDAVAAAGSQEAMWTEAAAGGWATMWAAATSLPTFGRLSAFSFAEYLRIGGVPFDCDTLLLGDMAGSRSHRNGLAKVLGRDDLDWHTSNPGFDGRYTPEVIGWLEEEGAALLDEARRRARGTPWERDVGYFTMESALCTYKSWHRPNRRYPNVYNDMMFDRLRRAERHWGPDDIAPIWEARAATLPEHLRLEDTPADPGCVPVKQNHYLRTGQVIMMHREWPCFANDFNAAVDARSARRTTTAEPRTVFPVCGLDRTEVRWEEQMATLTPITDGAHVRYKREDYFAPMGYGGINGAKLRQLLHLVARARQEGAQGIVTAASVLSPQVSMAALVGAHYGLPVTVMLGATNERAAIRHENVAIAAAAGARFEFTPVAYNPALQRAVAELAAQLPGWWRLQYGITTPADAVDEDIEAFHAVGARQVANVPDDVTTIVIPAGSCNSCTSVLYGIARTPPAGLKRVVLFGIGPTRLDWIDNRLDAIHRVTGLDVGAQFRRRYHHHPEQEGGGGESAPYVLEHYDLHATRWATYQDRRPWSQDGIEFHPTYEGKVMAYMSEHADKFEWFHHADGDALFWIVGSAPRRAAMQGLLP